MIGAHIGVTAELEWTHPSTWSGVVNGRSSILFALIAGVSVALASGGRSSPVGADLRAARLRMVGRALVVLAIGVALEMLGTYIAIILPLYGILFLIITPFLGTRRRTLVITAAGIALLGPTLIAAVQTLTLGGGGPGAELLLTGTYPLTAWLPLMLVGMALGRSDLRRTAPAVGLILIGLVPASIGYATGSFIQGALGEEYVTDWELDEGSSVFLEDETELPMEEIEPMGRVCLDSGDGWLTCYPPGDDFTEWNDGSEYVEPSYWEQVAEFGGWEHIVISAWSAYPHSGGTPEIIGSGGFAAVVLGVCLLLGRRLRAALLPLIAMGSMPLTTYSLHVLSYALIREPFGLLADDYAGYETNTVWITSVVVLAIGSTLWALWRGRGPLEALSARGADAMAR